MNFLFVSFIVFAGIVSSTTSQSTDETLTARAKGADVADAVVKKIQRSGVFAHDQNLLRRVAFVETAFGEDDKTYRAGYNGGIWQMDQETFDRTQNAPSLAPQYLRINSTWGISWNGVGWEELLKPFYSGLAARLFFNTIPAFIPGTINTQADYWKAYYRTNTNVSVETFKTAVRRLESDGICEGLLDICIVLDGSGSIGPDPFVQAKKFVADLVKSFSLKTTRVAFIRYANDATEIFNFNNNLTEAQMESIIQNTAYTAGGTNTPAGLEMAVRLFNESSPRPGVPRVVATFTDGNSNLGNLPSAIQKVKGANLTSFAIGIGTDITEGQLLDIALGETSRVYRVQDYDALVEFLYQMNTASCEVPQEPEVGTEQSGTLSSNEKRYFKYRVPEIGLTLKVSTTGRILGWYSYTEQTPNSALNDGVINAEKFIRRNENEGNNASSSVFITIQSNSTGSIDYVMSTVEGNHVSSAAKIVSTSIILLSSMLLCYIAI